MSTSRNKLEWHDEPSIDELLSDPIAQLVMRYDGIDESDVRRVMEQTGRRLRVPERAA